MSTTTKIESESSAVNTINMIENALDKLLTTILLERNRTGRFSHQIVSFQPSQKFAELIKASDVVLKTREQSDTDFLLDKPIEGACLIAIRRLGAELFKVGGTDAMRESLERVCERQRKSCGRRMSILDSWWNGIGSDSDRWCS